MSSCDFHGNALSGGSPAAREHYERALCELACYAGDPAGAANAALRESPRLVMAHVLLAYLNLIGTDPGGVPAARSALDAAAGLPATERERAHLAAAEALASGRFREAARVLEDVALAHPRDLLALIVGHNLDFLTGESRMLRDRIARALPAWSDALPGHHALLGMHAFGLEETGDYARAEAQGRLAIALQPRDGWAQHAVAHVLEMQGRPRDGIAWMTEDVARWTRESFFCVHNWWHLALFHLELGESKEALALFDGPIYGAESKVAFDLLDASSFLWRLSLRGVDVGERWHAVAQGWASIATPGAYAFNDVHAVMAHLGAGRESDAAEVVRALDEASRGEGDAAAFSRDVGLPVARALVAFHTGEHARCVELLRRVRPSAHRFGGSHAQRDVLDLTLFEAARRAGDGALARALAAERLDRKPESPFCQRLAQLAAASAEGAAS
jgi:tetratricopeptide (TPR) repeat protein